MVQPIQQCAYRGPPQQETFPDLVSIYWQPHRAITLLLCICTGNTKLVLSPALESCPIRLSWPTDSRATAHCFIRQQHFTNYSTQAQPSHAEDNLSYTRQQFSHEHMRVACRVLFAVSPRCLTDVLRCVQVERPPEPEQNAGTDAKLLLEALESCIPRATHLHVQAEPKYKQRVIPTARWRKPKLAYLQSNHAVKKCSSFLISRCGERMPGLHLSRAEWCLNSCAARFLIALPFQASLQARELPGQQKLRHCNFCYILADYYRQALGGRLRLRLGWS